MAADESGPTVDAREALRQLNGLALSEHSLQSVLQTVADLTKQVLPGGIEVSVSVLVTDRPTSFVSTGQLALDLDETQYGHGYGPCLRAATTGEPIEISDTRTDPRWTGYMQRAVELGVLSSLSLPLGSSEQMAAGLNIYAQEPAAFGGSSRRDADDFAHFAGVAVANIRSYDSARETADNLQRRWSPGRPSTRPRASSSSGTSSPPSRRSSSSPRPR